MKERVRRERDGGSATARSPQQPIQRVSGAKKATLAITFRNFAMTQAAESRCGETRISAGLFQERRALQRG